MVNLLPSTLWLAASVRPQNGHKPGNGGSSNSGRPTMKKISTFRLPCTIYPRQNAHKEQTQMRGKVNPRKMRIYTCPQSTDLRYTMSFWDETCTYLLLKQRLVVCFHCNSVSVFSEITDFTSSHSLHPRLLAATMGPLANVTSIAALVTYWRQDLIDLEGEVLSPLQGIPIRDPRWYVFNDFKYYPVTLSSSSHMAGRIGSMSFLWFVGFLEISSCY